MSEYQLEIKQIVDYPRCRIYRQFIQMLLAEKNIRIGGSANRLAANFVLEIAKIIRGYGGSAVFATQDLKDFFALDDGKYGKGIINNCKTKIVLNLEDEEAQRVQSILHLSEAEVMEITHFERGN